MIYGIDCLKKIYPDFDDENYQPAGLDLNVGKVYEVNQGQVIGIVNGQKMSAAHLPVERQDFPEYDLEDVWEIKPGIPYIFEVDRQIKIDESNVQVYKPRSTLLRNAISVETAVGDPGYNGHLSFLVINHNPVNSFFISKGERFAQLLNAEVKGNSESYDGDYQEEVKQ